MLPKQFSISDTIRIGVLLAPPPVQFLDIAPVDLFHMLSKEYLASISMLPQPVRDLAIKDLRIMYIGDVSSIAQQGFANTDSHEVPLTADARLRVTASLTSPEVQPGKLSILIIPGPDPSAVPSEAYRSFIAAHGRSGVTDIITICTGIYPACYSGVCDGHNVSGPRALAAELRKKFPKVQAFEDKRWCKSTLGSDSSIVKIGQRHAELWTAGGITNGQDCIAAYMREHFNLELAEIICRMADVGDRGQQYTTGQIKEGVWWTTRILRSILKGLWKY